LLALDCTVVLLGLWPLLDTGEARAGQIALLALLGEIMQRLRLETRRVLAVGSTGATLALIAYVLFVARHGGSWRNTVIWIALFILVAVAGNTHRRWLPGYRPFRIRGNEERFPEPSASSPLKQPELPSAPLPASGVSPSESVLTSRQREVLRLAERRKPTREIADVLGISEETVKTHLRDAAKLLGTHTRFQAARVARERGWLD